MCRGARGSAAPRSRSAGMYRAAGKPIFAGEQMVIAAAREEATETRKEEAHQMEARLREVIRESLKQIGTGAARPDEVARDDTDTAEDEQKIAGCGIEDQTEGRREQLGMTVRIFRREAWEEGRPIDRKGRKMKRSHPREGHEETLLRYVTCPSLFGQGTADVVKGGGGKEIPRSRGSACRLHEGDRAVDDQETRKRNLGRSKSWTIPVCRRRMKSWRGCP